MRHKASVSHLNDMLRSPIFRYFYLPWAAGICLMLIIRAQPLVNSELNNVTDHIEITPHCPPSETLVKVIRISPRFSGCPDTPEIDECAGQLLEDYLYGNTAYPASPDNEGTAGLAVVQLRITPSGKMEEINLLRDPGYGRGADALRIIRKMQQQNILWDPASINGQLISFPITLKVRYSNFHWGG